MKITDVIWLEDIVEKLARKHNVKQHEVIEVLKNRHRKGEDVYAALGQTNSGRYMTVFFVYKASNQALIVSTRDMTKSERKKYEQR